MAIYGQYGWTPAQMERINARRAARGQQELVNAPFQTRNEPKRNTPIQKNPVESEDNTAVEDEGKPAWQKRNEEMQRKSIDKQLRDIEFRKRFGRSSIGIGTPMTQDAMYRTLA